MGADAVHKKRAAMLRRISMEQHWYPNRDWSDYDEWANVGDWFSAGLWDSDEITSVPPMCFTDNPSKHGRVRSSLQICSIKIASITGGLRWPLEVFGMVTVRDVLDDRQRNIVYARTRSNCQTITEKDPFLTLTGPTRAVVTCMDAGCIEIVLKAKGATESEDRDLSFLVVLLKSGMYYSYDKDYTSKRSTLRLNFRHLWGALEGTISVRHIGGGSSLPPGAFQGAFTASTASIEDEEVLLLAFKDGELPISDDGTISLSRRVVSVKHNDKERLKVSIVAQSTNHEQGATRDDVEFTPECAGRSYGELNVGAWKMQVTVAWSLFGDPWR